MRQLDCLLLSLVELFLSVFNRSINIVVTVAYLKLCISILSDVSVKLKRVNNFINVIWFTMVSNGRCLEM